MNTPHAFRSSSDDNRRWLRSANPNSRQRGATLTSYALVMAVMVASILGVLTSLEDNSEDLLVGTGDQIGTPRIPSPAAATSVVPAPPSWASTVLPASVDTYHDAGLSIRGHCLTKLPSSADLVSVPCGYSPAPVDFSATSPDGATLRLTVGTDCLAGDPAASVQIRFEPCDPTAPNQAWEQIAVSESSFTYVHQASGMCIQGRSTGTIRSTLLTNACSLDSTEIVVDL